MNHFAIYNQWDIEPVEGRGCKLWDRHGVEYLDLYGGHAVISVGHGHPAYVEAVGRQLSALGFYSNAVKNTLQERLAERLGVLAGYPHYALFLCNSGAEANENALKIASFHTGKQKIIAFRGAFHGRTSGAVAATDNPAIVAPFNRTENVVFLPLNDRDAVERALASIKATTLCIAIDSDLLFPLSEMNRLSRHIPLAQLGVIASAYGHDGFLLEHEQLVDWLTPLFSQSTGKRRPHAI